MITYWIALSLLFKDFRVVATALTNLLQDDSTEDKPTEGQETEVLSQPDQSNDEVMTVRRTVLLYSMRWELHTYCYSPFAVRALPPSNSYPFLSLQPEPEPVVQSDRKLIPFMSGNNSSHHTLESNWSTMARWAIKEMGPHVSYMY